MSRFFKILQKTHCQRWYIIGQWGHKAVYKLGTMVIARYNKSTDSKIHQPSIHGFRCPRCHRFLHTSARAKIALILYNYSQLLSYCVTTVHHGTSVTLIMGGVWRGERKDIGELQGSKICLDIRRKSCDKREQRAPSLKKMVSLVSRCQRERVGTPFCDSYSSWHFNASPKIPRSYQNWKARYLARNQEILQICLRVTRRSVGNRISHSIIGVMC